MITLPTCGIEADLPLDIVTGIFKARKYEENKNKEAATWSVASKSKIQEFKH